MSLFKKAKKKVKKAAKKNPIAAGAIGGFMAGGPLGAAGGAIAGAVGGGKVKKGWQDITGQTAAKKAARKQQAGVDAALGAEQAGTADALEAQAGGFADARAAQESYQQQQMALLNPTIQTGQNAMNQMGGLVGLQGADAQQQAISGLEDSPMFQAMLQQQESAMLQNASATGGLRGGNTQAALAQFRPAMLNQQIQQQMSNLGGLANMGMNPLAQAAGGLMSTGQGISGLHAQQGMTEAELMANSGRFQAGLHNQSGQQQGALALGKYQMGRDFGFDLAGLGIQGAKAAAGFM